MDKGSDWLRPGEPPIELRTPMVESPGDPSVTIARYTEHPNLLASAPTAEEALALLRAKWDEWMACPMCQRGDDDG